jgi:coatomer protein complex subunit epsilon
MADRDILFAVRNSFYIGAYNNAINEASDMEGLTEAEQTERDVYVYRSYIALGSHDVSPANMAVLFSTAACAEA